MTNEEALTIFRNPWLATESGLDEAEAVAISALEKQIPQKFEKGKPYTWIDTVRKNGRRIDVKKTSYEKDCPICKKMIVMGDAFCRHCGQAIDWSEYD